MNDSPFAHRIARKPKTGKAPAETRPVPIIIGHIPMTQDELASETEIETVMAKPAAIPANAVKATDTPAPQSSAMRQTVVALVAFTVTICAIAGAVLVLKSVFTTK